MRCGGYTREHFHVFTPLLTALVMFWAYFLRDDEMQDAVKPTGTCWRGVRISKHTEVQRGVRVNASDFRVFREPS